MKQPPDDLGGRLLAASELVLRAEDPPRFDDIAEQIGASRATLYYYFAGRDDLVAWVLDAHVRRGGDAMASADPGEAHPPLARLESVISGALAYLAERPHVCTGLLAAAGAGGSMAAVMAANDTHVAARLRSLLEAAQGAGEILVGDVADAANVVLGALLLAVIGRSSAGRQFPQAAQHDVVRQVMVGLAAD